MPEKYKKKRHCRKAINTYFIYLSQGRFILEITQKLSNNVGVSFKNKKARFIDHTVYIPLSLYAGSGGTPWGLCPILCPTICVPFRVKFDLFWVCLTKKKPLNKEGLFINQVEDIYFLFFECLTL